MANLRAGMKQLRHINLSAYSTNLPLRLLLLRRVYQSRAMYLRNQNNRNPRCQLQAIPLPLRVRPRREPARQVNQVKSLSRKARVWLQHLRAKNRKPQLHLRKLCPPKRNMRYRKPQMQERLPNQLRKRSPLSQLRYPKQTAVIPLPDLSPAPAKLISQEYHGNRAILGNHYQMRHARRKQAFSRKSSRCSLIIIIMIRKRISHPRSLFFSSFMVVTWR